MHAYVTVLYGNNIYLTGALVMGYTLMKTGTKLDRLILVTPDVSSEYRSYLAMIYTRVIPIDYVPANIGIFSNPETRFIDVFTKLSALDLTQYQKVLLLDTDMIVTQNIDHLFKLNPPAAVLKRHHVKYGHKIPSSYICADGKLIGSINAGLMLLKPDRTEWANIQADIQSDVQLHQFKYPEQDYLSLRYCDKWTSITFNYNYQFGLTGRTKRYRYRLNDIYVIHYSSSFKPWSYLNPDFEPDAEEIEFKNQHRKYYDLWEDAYTKVKEKFTKQDMQLPY